VKLCFCRLSCASSTVSTISLSGCQTKSDGDGAGIGLPHLLARLTFENIYVLDSKIHFRGKIEYILCIVN
jgi:hypothetical protein